MHNSINGNVLNCKSKNIVNELETEFAELAITAAI